MATASERIRLCDGVAPNRYEQMSRILTLWQLVNEQPSSSATELKEQLMLEKQIQVCRRTVFRDLNFLLAMNLVECYRFEGTVVYEARPEALLSTDPRRRRFGEYTAEVRLQRVARRVGGDDEWPEDERWTLATDTSDEWDDEHVWNLAPDIDHESIEIVVVDDDDKQTNSDDEQIISAGRYKLVRGDDGRLRPVTSKPDSPFRGIL